MGLFDSKTLKVKFDDPRTNLKEIRFEKSGIEVSFNGIKQSQLDSMVECKAANIRKQREKEYKEKKGAFRAFFHSEDDIVLPRVHSELTFVGDHVCKDLVYDVASVEQISPDAFRLKGKFFELLDLKDAIYEFNVQEYEIKEYLKNKNNAHDEEAKRELEEIENELQKLNERLDNDYEAFDALLNKVKKQDNEGLAELSEYTIYVTPMGLSLSADERYTNLPMPAPVDKKNQYGFNINQKELRTRVYDVVLKHFNAITDDDDPDNDDMHFYHAILCYHFNIDANVIENVSDKERSEMIDELEIATVRVNGFFKPASLRKVSETEFKVQDYISGKERTFYIGAYGITENEKKQCTVDSLNPANPHWFMNL